MLSRYTALPRTVQVLLIWAAGTLLTGVFFLLSAASVPATPWADAVPSLPEHWSFWDSGWYERIVEEGYPSVLPVDDSGAVTQNAWAFMPLFPYLVGLLSLTGLSFFAAGALLSAVSSATSAVLLDRWLAPRVGPAVSLWAVALFWASPCALVLQVPYAEALALALVSGALLLVDRGHYLAAAPLILVAAITRPVGAPIALGVGLWWLWKALRQHDWDWPLAGLTIFAGASAGLWPAIAWLVTGQADAYTATETAWRGGHLQPFLPWLSRSGEYVGTGLSGFLLLAILALAALALTSRPTGQLGDVARFWCAGYLLYLLLFFDPTTSLFRLLLPLAPLSWALAAALPTARARWAALLLGVVGQLFWISWIWNLGSISISWIP